MLIILNTSPFLTNSYILFHYLLSAYNFIPLKCAKILNTCL